MTGNRAPTAPDSPTNDDDDDAPDLTASPWTEKLATAPVARGRPRSLQTKVSTTIRLDEDVLERFRSEGPGWQSRINQALREWLARH